MKSEKGKAAQRKYDKANIKMVAIGLHRETDKEIISILDRLPKGEKSGFIKRAIKHYSDFLNL